MPIVDRMTAAPGLAPSPAYSHAVTVTGRIAFVAGQVALDADGQLVGPGDLGAQTSQCLRNLESVLTALGADWSCIARLCWYVLDVTEVQALRDARRELMRDQPNPASTLVQVASLVRPDFLVEVDAVVALPD